MEIEVLANEAAHYRTDHRPQRHHHLERAHRPTTLGTFEPIPDHGHRHHRTGCDTYRLQGAEQQQRLDVGREKTTDGRADVARQTEQQGAPAAASIHQRPVDDLHERQDKGEDRDAEVDQQRRGLQRLAQLRQDWRVDRLGEGTQKSGERHHEGQQAWAHRFSASSQTDARRRMPPGATGHSLTCMYSSAQTMYSSAVEYFTDSCEALRSEASIWRCSRRQS